MFETNRIEYKREITPDVDIEKEVIAFLNSKEGGDIFIGIDKLGNIVGVKDIDGDMLKIKDRIKTNILPSPMGLFDVVEETKNGISVIKINIASGSEKPYYKKKLGMTEKGCFIRLGTAAEPMQQALIDKYFASRTRNSIGKIKSNRQDLTFEQLRIYYEEKNKPLNKQFKKNLELINENGHLNYAAYLLADENNVSVKVAKYKGTTKVDLVENNELGFCSIIKATKSVLDKIDIENTTQTAITYNGRKDQRLWNAIALREAIINAFIHTDYTKETAPQFEIFSDRIEITSVGALPDGLSEKEFFEGFSIPRNKELIRVYKDVELVEQLGSGIPRILEHYDKSCFQFSENFLRITFFKAKSSNEVTNEVSNQVVNEVVKKDWQIIDSKAFEAVYEHLKTFVKNNGYKPTARSIEKFSAEAQQLTEQEYNILSFCVQPKKRKEILEDCLKLSNQTNNYTKNIAPLIEKGLIEFTIKDRPNSQFQRYIISPKGRVIRYLCEEMNNEKPDLP